jgi:hypothetical protein
MISAALATRRITTARNVLCGIAVAACLPYLALKIAWVCGSTFGIEGPGGSEKGAITALNTITVVMESVAVTSALALGRPWGQRLPAWLPVLPMWIAGGLLGTVLTAIPISVLTSGSSSQPSAGPPTHTSPAAVFVSVAVNGGIAIQGLTLMPLFILYARERWGHLLRGRIADLHDSPIRPVQKLAACIAALLAVLPLTLHLLWATGSGIGRSKAMIAAPNAFATALDAATIGMILVAAVAGLMIAFGRPRRQPLVLPLAFGWFGAGSMTAWGGWLLIASLIPMENPSDGPRFPPLAELTFAVQLLVGVLIFFVGACALAERASRLRSSANETDDAEGRSLAG